MTFAIADCRLALGLPMAIVDYVRDWRLPNSHWPLARSQSEIGNWQSAIPVFLLT